MKFEKKQKELSKRNFIVNLYIIKIDLKAEKKSYHEKINTKEGPQYIYGSKH